VPLTTLLRRRTATEVPPDENAWRVPEVVTGDPCAAIAETRWRQQVRVVGRVRSIRVQPRVNVPTMECTLVDGTGGITVVFLGRRTVAGIRLGTRMIVEGRAGSHHGKLAVLNPDYTLL